MKISTEIGSAAKLVGEEKAVEYVAKAGFDAWDFSMFAMFDHDKETHTIKRGSHVLSGDGYLSFARKLKNIADSCGIVCNQTHAPFPSYWPDAEEYLKRAIECTAEVGGKICVIHPNNNKTAEENAEMYRSLLEFSKGYGVKIATENMWNWSAELGHSVFAACATPDSFNAHLDAVNDECLVACLDIGHAEMLGSDTSAVEMVYKLGKRLKALHIHDNDKLKDSHQIPLSMNIDFPPIIRALKEIGYDGYFTLEASRYLPVYSADDVFGGLCALADSVKKLAEMFDALPV